MLSLNNITPKFDVQQLFTILEAQRPSGSQREEEFVDNVLLTIQGALQDEYGNVFVPVLMEQSSTMFSCHTDTVHPKPHANYKNNLQLDATKNHVFTDGKSQLGADDGTGIWFMLNMIEANIPGLYVFHRDEEIGGMGSTASAEINENYIESLGIKRCIAFDRHYYSDVITHQGTRCASDAFAKALSKELNVTPGFTFKPCDTGVFTDSANYTHMIQECTNISVGYWSQHTVKETQDLGFAEKLLGRLLKVNWEALPTERDVTDNDYAFDDDWMGNFQFGGNTKGRMLNPYDEINYIDEMDITEIVEVFPEAVAELLECNGYSDMFLREEIKSIMGMVMSSPAPNFKL